MLNKTKSRDRAGEFSENQRFKGFSARLLDIFNKIIIVGNPDNLLAVRQILLKIIFKHLIYQIFWHVGISNTHLLFFPTIKTF